MRAEQAYARSAIEALRSGVPSRHAVEHLGTTGDYLGYPSVRRNMKTFCSFLRAGIAWFLVAVEFWEGMNVEFSAGYIFDQLYIDPGPVRENIAGSIRGDGITLTLTSWRRWSRRSAPLF